MSQHYTFTVGDQTYTLPPTEDAAQKVSGRALRDATLDGDEGQTRLAFLMLEASGADKAAVDALYDLTVADMLEHIKAWFEFKPSEESASLGESSSSSD